MRDDIGTNYDYVKLLALKRTTMKNKELAEEKGDCTDYE